MDYDKMTKAELIEKLNEQKHLASAVEAKDNEMAAIKTQLQELKTKYQGAVTKDQIEDYTKKLEEERNQAFEIANLYIKAHRDLLKQTQQNLEMVIFTEELLSQKIKK